MNDITTVFCCQDNMDSIFTGIYDAWASRLGHSHVRLQLAAHYNYELFTKTVEVQPNPEKTEKVIRSIRTKISSEAWSMVYRAVLSQYESKADDIYRFLILGFHYGSCVTKMLTEPAVQRIHELNRFVGNEAHFFREFLRFDSMEQNILFARIRPKSNVLTLLTPHFADRISGENFLILDVGRNLASIHPANQPWYLTALTREEAEALLSRKPDQYRDLWKTFYDTIAIEERKNPRLQRNMMPLRYREFMPEI
ncbi:MAG: TIGR03915 family putative DNA repair protein [Clostridiales bacterium]|nr:TIGR03915 family putative DNA repair protein [Clostridiales bacterium]